MTFVVGEEVIVDFIYDNDVLEILSVRPADSQSLYRFADFDRRWVLIMVAVAVVVVALGGWRGATALIGLVVSVTILSMFVLPAILDGRSPVLGAAGALDDVTITQASTVWELQEANLSLDRKGGFRGALRVGRDHIASMVNTLLLAYAGASLPLLVLFVLAHQSLGTIANSEVVAVEIVRTLIGSIGLVAAVPLTTWLAARFYHAHGEPAS
ncbi:MAG: YibE/F family protein [Actinomycetia bacterium]|nr:YibE/F family protein [Actinomycetes bacterium]